MLALLVVMGTGSGCAAEDQAAAETLATSTTTPREAAADAVVTTELAFLDREQLIDVVADACAAMTSSTSTPRVARDIVEALDRRVETVTAAELEEVATTLGTVLPKACPDGVDSHPDLVNALVALAPTPTTTTSTTSTSTTTTPATTTAPPTTVPPTTAPPEPPPPPPPPEPTAPPATEPDPAPAASYANCTEARAAGAAPLYVGEPGYASKLDRDGDGVACE